MIRTEAAPGLLREAAAIRDRSGTTDEEGQMAAANCDTLFKV